MRPILARIFTSEIVFKNDRKIRLTPVDKSLGFDVCVCWTTAKAVRAPQRDPILERLRDGLEQLGLTSVSERQLQTALAESYPSGYEGEPTPSVLMTVFRHLKAKDRGI